MMIKLITLSLRLRRAYLVRKIILTTCIQNLAVLVMIHAVSLHFTSLETLWEGYFFGSAYCSPQQARAAPVLLQTKPQSISC